MLVGKFCEGLRHSKKEKIEEETKKNGCGIVYGKPLTNLTKIRDIEADKEERESLESLFL